MSKLSGRKTRTRFETDDLWQGRPLMIEAHPRYVEVWIKGQRTRFTLTYASIYTRACTLLTDQRRAERRKGGAR